MPHITLAANEIANFRALRAFKFSAAIDDRTHNMSEAKMARNPAQSAGFVMSPS
jgi:hypothetical protein